MKKLKAGDVFAIPISEEKTGFGQIVNIPVKAGNFLMAVFEKVYTGKDWPSLNEIVEDKILLLGYTMDGLLYHKYWQVIGNNASNVEKIKLPYFKLGTPPDMQIVNYRGDRVRRANRDEFDKLEYEIHVTPVRYENALKSYYKLDEWRDDYNKLLYEKTLESIKVVESK